MRTGTVGPRPHLPHLLPASQQERSPPLCPQWGWGVGGREGRVVPELLPLVFLAVSAFHISSGVVVGSYWDGLHSANQTVALPGLFHCGVGVGGTGHRAALMQDALDLYQLIRGGDGDGRV